MTLSSLFRCATTRALITNVFPVFLRQYSVSTPAIKQDIVRRSNTLKADLLKPSDLLDISDAKSPYIQVENHHVQLAYYTVKKNRHPFPPNTRGFLYYHSDPNTPSTLGEIRFRVIPAQGPINFSSGTDLMGHKFLPWSISLFTLKGTSYKPLKDLALREGLIDKSTLDMISQVVSKRHRNSLQYLEQPFVLNMQRRRLRLLIVTPHANGAVEIPRFFKDFRAHCMYHPYRGNLQLRFERSTEPEHMGSRILVLRVLKILEPIEVTKPDYDMHVPLPREGQLMEVNKGGNRYASRKGLFTIDLGNASSNWSDLGLLVPDQSGLMRTPDHSVFGIPYSY